LSYSCIYFYLPSYAVPFVICPLIQSYILIYCTNSINSDGVWPVTGASECDLLDCLSPVTFRIFLNSHVHITVLLAWENKFEMGLCDLWHLNWSNWYSSLTFLFIFLSGLYTLIHTPVL
jgi:hypothetical protein